MPPIKKTHSQNSLNDIMSINTNSNSNDIIYNDRTTIQVCNVIRFCSYYVYMSIKMFPYSSYIQNPFEFNVRYIQRESCHFILLVCMYMNTDKFNVMLQNFDLLLKRI
jgi:hypothetical protein